MKSFDASFQSYFNYFSSKSNTACKIKQHIQSKEMCDRNNNSLEDAHMYTKVKFHQDFFEILVNNPSILNNIWILNEIIFPFKNDHKKQPVKFTDLLKYASPVNDYNYYSNQRKNKRNHFDEEKANDMNLKHWSPKKHTHTLVALNKECQTSPPLILFPKDELISDMKTHNLNERACIDDSLSNFQSIDVKIFFKWLRFFVSEQKRKYGYKGMFVLLINSFLQSILFDNNEEQGQLVGELNSYCETEKVVFLFYPVDGKRDILNRNIFETFKEEWEVVWEYCVRRQNPNSQVTFVMAFNQVWRLLCDSNDLIKDCFDEIMFLKKQKEFVHGLNYKTKNDYNDQINLSFNSASTENSPKVS